MRTASATLLAFIVVLCGSVTLHAAGFEFVQDIANRINAERAKQGLGRLTYNDTLAKAAQSQAEWMARNRKREHLQPRMNPSCRNTRTAYLAE